jgi:hypothetical protein
MKLVIMNYSGATINFYDLPENIIQSEDVENWIVKNTEHRLGDIHYMTGDEIEIINH